MKTADKAIIDTMAAPRSILGRIQRELFGFDMATTNLPKNRKLEEKEAEKTQELTMSYDQSVVPKEVGS